MFRPPYLQSGDKVALVSPAGIIDPLSIHDAVEVLRSWELNPIVGPNAAATYGYFAGRDEQRLQDMQWALDDEDIRAIFCTRGGYGVYALSNNWIILFFKVPRNGLSDSAILPFSIRSSTRWALKACTPLCLKVFAQQIRQPYYD